MKKLLIVLIVFSACKTTKEQVIENVKTAAALGTMAVHGIGGKILADKQTVIK